MKEISTYISSILSLVSLRTNLLSKKSSTSGTIILFPLTTGSKPPTLAFSPAHVVDDAFATLANDFEETNNNSGNQGGSSDTCDVLGDIPVPLTVLQSQEVQFGISPGVEVLSLVRTRAGTLRAPVTNEQEVSDGLAVKGRGHGNARVNADNGNALPAKGKGKGRGRGRH